MDCDYIAACVQGIRERGEIDCIAGCYRDKIARSADCVTNQKHELRRRENVAFQLGAGFAGKFAQANGHIMRAEAIVVGVRVVVVAPPLTARAEEGRMKQTSKIASSAVVIRECLLRFIIAFLAFISI